MLYYLYICITIGRNSMATAKISQKGWIVIPAEYRKKYRLKTGDQVDVVDYGGILAIVPTPKNPVESARGLLKSKISLTKALLEERDKEREHEENQKINLHLR
jgi:AbrB family looped-hinge helix DNA binding protein